MVGLPQEQNLYCQTIARHLDWLGHRSKVFNVSNVVDSKVVPMSRTSFLTEK